MTTHRGFWLGSLVFGLALHAPTASGQSLAQVPIHGVTGTVALPETVDKFYSDAHKIIDKTGDGLNRVGRAATGTEVNEGAGSLEGLKPGTAVIVQYTVKGIQTSSDDVESIGRNSSRLNEGVVTTVDRPGKRITIAFSNGSRTTLRAARNPEHGGRVVVYSRDASGQQIAHYFKPLAS